MEKTLKILIWGTGIDYSPNLIDLLLNMMSPKSIGGGEGYWYNFQS